MSYLCCSAHDLNTTRTHAHDPKLLCARTTYAALRMSLNFAPRSFQMTEPFVSSLNKPWGSSSPPLRKHFTVDSNCLRFDRTLAMFLLGHNVFARKTAVLSGLDGAEAWFGGSNRHTYDRCDCDWEIRFLLFSVTILAQER